MKKRFKRRTAEEKKKQVEELFHLLEEGVINMDDPEKIKAALEMQALMPKYSFRNILIAKAQLPHARYLAPFSRWKELNRRIIKGEKAIRILAPRFKKVVDEETGEEQQQIIGFISVPVFDVSQTEGDPLPIDRIKLELEGESDEARQIFEWVKQVAAMDDCPVRLEKISGTANGYYNRIKHEIVIDSDLSINHRAKTAVHELVHSRVHRNSSASAEERECVAEGAAFVVCSYFGLDTSDYSFEYVRSWSKDEESILKYGETIQKVASEIISDFEKLTDAYLIVSQPVESEEIA